MDKVSKAKQVLIEDYLASRGYQPVNKGIGKYLFYKSMIRNEKVASFIVNKNKNRWKDMGLSDTKWNDVIALVMKLEEVDFIGALERLLNIKIVAQRRVEKKKNYRGIEIVHLSSLRNKALVEYLQSRKVDIDLARMYCFQALVKFPDGINPKQTHLYIAFRNDKGGYALRNHYKNSTIAKISSSPSYFTRIEGDPNKYNLFEGFVDYLTMLTKYKTHRFKNTTVVLNSLVNILYLYETLKSNEENNIFLNNDESADKYIWKSDFKSGVVSLKEQNIPYTDCRHLFGLANDINDFANGKIYI